MNSFESEYFNISGIPETDSDLI